MKNSIEWHEDVLKNQEHSLQEMKEKIERNVTNYNRQFERVAFHRLQIKEAKKFGKDGFDGERFMKNRQ